MINDKSLWELRQIIENANRLEILLNKKDVEISQLKKEFGVPQSFTLYPRLTIKYYDSYCGMKESGYFSDWQKNLKPTIVAEALTAWKTECDKIKVKNEPTIKHNLELLEKAKKLFISLGLKETVRKPVGRSRIKTHDVRAEWVNELDKAIPINDGYYLSVEEPFKRYSEALIKWNKELAEHEVQNKRAEEVKSRENKRLNTIATFRVKYNLEPDAEFDDILDALLMKDKYLSLAHYLQKNRGDWNDGYSYAETGLGYFTVETPEDIKIEREISDLITNWDGDGRCFRDCTYNYDYLFGLVIERNKDLYLDYQKLMEISND